MNNGYLSFKGQWNKMNGVDHLRLTNTPVREKSTEGWGIARCPKASAATDAGILGP